MLNTTSINIARTLFKLKVYENNGQAFQDLFTKVMRHKYKNFKKVKPQGTKGDMGNDGYRKGEGIFYQVYAPENASDKDGYASGKAFDDFDRLFSFWNSIETVKEYFFVFNDKYLGEYPTTRQSLSDVETRHANLSCDLFVAQDLEDIFLTLDENQIVDVVGLLPSADEIQLIGFDCLNEAISHLLQLPRNLEHIRELVVPDLSEKIRFNNLSSNIDGLLKSAQLQSHALEEFFRNHPSKTVRKDLQQIFIEFYEQSKKDLSDLSTDNNDAIFFDVLHKATGNKRSDKQIQDAVLVLMSYYFEHCDIFEEPQLL